MPPHSCRCLLLLCRRDVCFGLQVVVTRAMLQEAWDGLRGAVTIAYPQGLPEYDEVQMLLLPPLAPQLPPTHAQVQAVLDDNFDADGMTQECVPVETAELWWAGKKMTGDKLLSDFVGRNDKTKVRALPPVACALHGLSSSRRRRADSGQAAEARRWGAHARAHRGRKDAEGDA
jgi:hypothetical protein